MVFPFAYFVGAVALLAAPSLPSAWIGAVCALVGVTSLFLRKRWRGAIAICGLCCGFAITAIHAREYLVDRWPAALADERVIASITVDSIPAPLDEGVTFDGVVAIESPDAWVGRPELRVRVVSRDASITPRAGERWRLVLALRPPGGRANPGAHDIERQLFRDRVHAFGTVVKSSVNRRVDSGHRPLTALRERISRHIEARVVDRDASALISALAVGDTGRVSREQWRVFNVTGITHLVAISGLHVTLFAVVAFFAARRIWSMCVSAGAARWSLPLRVFHWVASCPRETFAAVLGFTAAAAYAALAGLSVPTQRTLIMLGAWLFARSMSRVTRPFQPFAISLIVVLLMDPFAPLSSGFWLSFAAMAAIIATTSGHFARRPLWREALAVQAVVTVALVPVSLAMFGSISVIGPLVNVVAIPLMSWILVPCVLLSVALMPISTFLGDGVLGIAAALHDAGWPLLAAASEVPWALIHASPPLWWYALSAIAIVMALLPWPLPARLAALVCVVPLAAAVDSRLPSGVAEITVLDVGEGTSVVVRTANHALVFGTGDSFGTRGRVAESVVAPFLRRQGVRAIDRFVASGNASEAGEGVTALIAEMPLRETPDSPAAWQWDGIDFELLGDASVLSVRVEQAAHAGQIRALIPASLDARTEARLAGLHDLRSDLVIVPRNGSDSASSPTFVDAVNARWAVVSGRRLQGLSPNSSARPALTRWQRSGAEVLATADFGAIRFTFDATRGVRGPESERDGRDGGRRTLWATAP